MHCNREHSALSNVQRPKGALHEMYDCLFQCAASSVQVCCGLLADCQEGDGRSKKSDISSTGRTAVQI